jgi:hypothetical protein
VFLHHPPLEALTFDIGGRGVAKPAVVLNDLPLALSDEGN